MSYNYTALDSFEFELLARDVVEEISGIKLSCYTAGRDGGIDASDYFYHKGLQGKIVVQAKRWTGSTDKSRWLKTVDALADQLKRDDNVPSDALYVVTSQGLSSELQREIIDSVELKGFPSCIVLDGVKLDQFLDASEHRSILQRHFKLWIAGVNVLQSMMNRSVDIDTDVFLRLIESHRDLYVQTSLFDKAIDLLRHNSVLLITGNPGTGKSVLTQMITLHLCAANYKVVFSSCNKLSSLKSVSSVVDDPYELYVLDDFLGQRNLDAEIDQMRELVTFLRFVSPSRHRRVVLNSRISIFNEARRRDDSFRQFVDNISSSIVTIDTSSMTLADKGRIFVSNLTFGKVPDVYVSSLRERSDFKFKRAMKCVGLCNHRNYNPRILEYCCCPDFWGQLEPSQFYKAILDKLNHPDDVWRNEFEDRFGKVERMLSFLLFSLSDGPVPVDSLKAAFDARVELETGLDSTIDSFNRAISRLQRSIVTTTIVDGRIYASMANPSINDYCASCLSVNDAECSLIVRTARFADQFERISKVNQCPAVISAVRDVFSSGRIYELPFADDLEKPVVALGFKVISNCESQFNASDYPWIAAFIETALQSTTERSWSEVSSFLFARSHHQAFIESESISRILCEIPLFGNLVTGTSYMNASLLFRSATRVAAYNSGQNQEAVFDVFVSRYEDWLYDFAYDFIDDWINDNCSPDSFVPTDGFEDQDEWEDFVRDDIKQCLESNINGSILKQEFSDRVGKNLALNLSDSDYSLALENAIDNCIWNLSIPVRVFDDGPGLSLRNHEGFIDEIAIVERMFSDYSCEQFAV